MVLSLDTFERSLFRGDVYSLRQLGFSDAAALVSGHLDQFLPQPSDQHPTAISFTLSQRIAHQCAVAAFEDVTMKSPLLADALSSWSTTNPDSLVSAYIAGVALLNVFLRQNWTGPVSVIAPPRPGSDAAPLYLSLDGEDVVRSPKSLYCLRAARFILVDSLDIFVSAGAKLSPWWAARTMIAHQIILSNPVPTLQHLIFHMFARFLGPDAARTRYLFETPQISPPTDDENNQSKNGDKREEEEEEDDDFLPAPVPEGGSEMFDEEDLYVRVLDERPSDISLHVLAHLELAHAQKLFYDSDGALDSLRRASELSQVAVRMSGEMGVRTKHQRKETAQLIARAFQINDIPSKQRADLQEGRLEFNFPFATKKIIDSPDTSTAKSESNELPLPQDVQVNDSDVLGYVKLSDLKRHPLEEIPVEKNDDPTEVFQIIEDLRLGNEIDFLTPLEQALCLAHASIVRARNASHVLTNEEMAPFVDMVLRNSESPFGTSSVVQLRALLYRVSFERNRGRFLERCMAQMEVLAKFIENPMAESTAEVRAKSTAERVALILASSMPPKWDLMKELAVSFGKIGLVKSAMEIFEKYEFWDELVDCHRLIGNLGRAEALVREHLELLDSAVLEDGIIDDDDEGFNPTKQIANRAAQERAARRPRLLCVLGEVTRDPSHFETAWTESGGRYGRAKRALARLYVEKEDWPKALVHFRDALKINPLFPDAWFSYGCAALKVGDLHLAGNAFTTVVQQTPDNAEAWNNLGRTLYDTGKKKEALKALTEAAKLHRDSYRIWGNVVVLAMELRSSMDIVRGLERLLDLRGKDGIMTDAIGVAISEVSRLLSLDNSDEKANVSHLCKRLLTLLGRCSALVSTNASIWAAYAELHELMPDVESKQKAFDCRMKQVRSLVAHGDWKSERKDFRHMAIACTHMVTDALDSSIDNNIRSARLQLDSVIDQTIESFKEDEGFARLVEIRRKLSDENGSIDGGLIKQPQR